MLLTKPIAKRLYEKLSSASPGWFKTKDGKRLVAKSIKHVEQFEGKEEAEILRNLLTVCEAANMAQGFEK